MPKLTDITNWHHWLTSVSPHLDMTDMPDAKQCPNLKDVIKWWLTSLTPRNSIQGHKQNETKTNDWILLISHQIDLWQTSIQQFRQLTWQLRSPAHWTWLVYKCKEIRPLTIIFYFCSSPTIGSIVYLMSEAQMWRYDVTRNYWMEVASMNKNISCSGKINNLWHFI